MFNFNMTKVTKVHVDCTKVYFGLSKDKKKEGLPQEIIWYWRDPDDSISRRDYYKRYKRNWRVGLKI